MNGKLTQKGGGTSRTTADQKGGVTSGTRADQKGGGVITVTARAQSASYPEVDVLSVESFNGVTVVRLMVRFIYLGSWTSEEIA